MKRYLPIVVAIAILIIIGIVIGTLIFSGSNDLPNDPPVPVQQRNFSPYYNNLDAEHKSLYDYICSSAQLFQDRTEALPFAFEISDLEVVCDSIRADHPDLFYIDFAGLQLEHSKTASSVILKYTDSKKNLKSMIEEYNQAIVKFNSEVDSSMTELEKEQYINDFLCENCKRSSDENILHNTAYGALVLKSAYCDGYSYAAKALLDNCKIESYIVLGKAGDENHVWNLVKTENGYAHLDVMWNDADIEDKLHFHGYFNLSDEEIKKDHTVSDKYTFIPEAGTAINYYYKNNLHAEKLSDIEDIIYNQLEQSVKDKKQYIELLCDETKENSKIAPYYENARKKLNKKLGYEAIYEPFCIYEANKTNNAVTVKIFTPEGKK